MKSLTLKSPSSLKEQPEKRRTTLEFEKGLDRSLLSGVKRITLREGKRQYDRFITVHGKPAIVERFRHTTLLHIDFETLVRNGHKNMFTTLMTLHRYYPDLTMNTIITVVEFRLLV